MKKFRIFAVLVMAIAFITGCSMKTDFVLKINASKKVTFGAVMAMDNDLIDTMLSMDTTGNGDSSKTPTDKERWAYVEEAFKDSKNEDLTYEKYEEGKFKGYSMTSEAVDIDEATKDSSSSRANFANFFGGEASDSDAVFFTRDGKYYVSNLSFDSTDNDTLGEMTSNSSSMEFFEFKFVVSLPVKPVSHNADEVSANGKTLTWDLSKGAKKIDFKFSFDGAKDTEETKSKSLIPTTGNKTSGKETTETTTEKKDKKDYTLYFVIGGAAVLVAGAIVFVGLNNKKKSAN